jgi:ribulose-phosphate 3-epimerase
MFNKIISASILSANFAKLGEEADNVLSSGADWIHFDVMDNHFVPNLTVGPMVCQSLRDYGIKAPIDVHLMVQPVDQLITAFAASGASIITIHPESTDNLTNSINLIKNLGCKAGIAFNPESPIDVLEYIYNQLDLILIMSVHPGFSGQQFINNSFKKIELIKAMLNKLNYNIPLSIDGGVNIENIATLAAAGINIFVAGNSIFKNKFNNNYKNIIADLRNKIL